MKLSASNRQWAKAFAEHEGITLDQVINNAITDFRARLAAEQVVFGAEEGDPLKQFQKKDGVLLEGEGLYDFMAGEYLDFFGELKIRMIEEQFYESSED